MSDSLRVRAISLVPPAYRPQVKELYGSKKNTLVYKLPLSDGNTKRVAFTFNGHTLTNPLQLMRKFGSDVVGKVQILGWKIFPKDSRGNFLIYVDPGDIDLKSDNNLVYRSSGIITTNSPGTIFIRTTNSSARDSKDSTFFTTANSHALQSPVTTYTHAKSCTVLKSKEVKIESSDKDNPCANVTVNGTQGAKITECTASELEKCIDTVLERCARVKATLCRGLHVSDTADKDLKNLGKRRITNGALELKWYEGIPVLGSLFKPAI